MQNPECSICINAPVKYVFHTAARYPLFVSHFKERKILAQDQDDITIQAGYSLCGILPVRWVGHGKKDPYKAITWEQTQGLLKGMRAYWRFDDLGNQTQVSIKTQVTIPLPIVGKLMEWAVGGIVSKNVRGILKSLKQAAEQRTVLNK